MSTTAVSKMSFFSHGNPLATPIGQLIEKATDSGLASENWALNMEICDTINETDEGPKDAIRALKKRIQQNVGKNYQVIMHTLLVLETCVKNCGRRFHIQIANKDFLHDLIKIIGPKNDPPTAVQEKVLSLIQAWADAFRGSPDLKEVEKVYQDLKTKGIEFPMTDLDMMPPIYTPARSAPEVESPPSQRLPQQQQQPIPHTMPAYPQYPPQQEDGGVVPPPTGQAVMPSRDQMGKMKSELDLVEGNVRVLSEMLTELSPTNTEPDDLQLLQELNRTCHQMQQRLVGLLDTVGNEEVTNELLRVNDDLNNVFLRYERFERYRTGQTGPSPAATPGGEEEEPHIPSHPPPPSYDQNYSPSHQAFIPISIPVSHQKLSSQHRTDKKNRDIRPKQKQKHVGEFTNPNVGNLIDFGDDGSAPAHPPPYPVSNNDIHMRLANMNMGSESVSSTLGQLNTTPAAAAAAPQRRDDEFDMFAQSRQAFDENKQAQESATQIYQNQQMDEHHGGLAGAVNARVQPTPGSDGLQDKPREYDEMEGWLHNSHSTPEQAPSGMTSSEFDKFLAERAAAADQLPDVTTNQQSARRQMQKDEEDHNTLFAL